MRKHYQLLKQLFHCSFAISLLTLLCSCMPMRSGDGPPSYYVNAAAVHDAVPKVEPRCPYGNPSTYCVDGRCYHVLRSSRGYNRVGYASWYGTLFDHQPTSSREPYSLVGMTAASKDLPIPTYVRVTNLRNGRSVIVKVNDRGPFHSGRIIDLSYVAALKLGYANRGTTKVRVTAIDPRTWNLPHHGRVICRRPRYIYADHGHRKHSYVHSDHHSQTQSATYLQAAAFTTHQKALSFAHRVARMTHSSTRIVSSHHNGHRLYKVQIGPLHNVATVNHVQQILVNHGLNRAVAVR